MEAGLRFHLHVILLHLLLRHLVLQVDQLNGMYDVVEVGRLLLLEVRIPLRIPPHQKQDHTLLNVIMEAGL